MGERRRKDTDSAEQVFKFKAGFYAATAGLVLGGAAGALLAAAAGIHPLLGVLIGVPPAAAIVYGVTIFLTHRSGDVAKIIYTPSGRSTPARRDYSFAQSLAMRGQYEEAARAYTEACEEFPDDPEPYFGLSRLFRDHLHRYEDAIRWLELARLKTALDPGHEILAAQEIIEMYVQKLHAPRKAIPELARLAERFPDTPAGEAAQRELVELRDMMTREYEGQARLTDQFFAQDGSDPFFAKDQDKTGGGREGSQPEGRPGLD
jgi:tetratricopeptide (TPR) repeat protein